MEYNKLYFWLESRKLVTMLYTITKIFAKEKLFELSNQMRRASVSIPSNIAVEYGRQTSKDTISFLYIFKGSLYELETQFLSFFGQKFY
jgi:four helix bundle protein